MSIIPVQEYNAQQKSFNNTFHNAKGEQYKRGVVVMVDNTFPYFFRTQALADAFIANPVLRTEEAMSVEDNWGGTVAAVLVK